MWWCAQRAEEKLPPRADAPADAWVPFFPPFLSAPITGSPADYCSAVCTAINMVLEHSVGGVTQALHLSACSQESGEQTHSMISATSHSRKPFACLLRAALLLGALNCACGGHGAGGPLVGHEWGDDGGRGAAARGRHVDGSYPLPAWKLPESPGSYSFDDLKRGVAGVFPEPERRSASRQAWQRVAGKLHAGEGVTLYGVGSSVLGAHGGCSEPLPVLKALCGTCCMLQGTQPAADMSGELAESSRACPRPASLAPAPPEPAPPPAINAAAFIQ